MTDLDKLAALEDNWDGDGADSPQPKALDAARLILEYTPAPDRMLPTWDGGIILEWQPKGAAIFEIEIESDGKAELMVHEVGGEPYFITLPHL